MKFFENLFKIPDNNYYGISGLTLELNCIYIYDTFIKQDGSVLVVTNSLYEANNFYQRLLNYTDKVLFFPMDDFITSEAIAISPEFKVERINTLNKLVNNGNYIVICNLMGVLRYLPTKKTWKDSILNLKKDQDYEREVLLNKLYNLGYENETIVTETGKVGVRGYVVDIFPTGEENPVRIEFWGDTIDSIKYFDVETQLTTKEIKEINIFPYTEFILSEEKDDIERKQKYLQYYSDKISGIWDYVNNNICFYYDYGQLINSYYLLRESILEYDKENCSSIKTNYMYDIENVNCNNQIYLMNVDNLLENLKLNKNYKFLSYNIENYEGNYNLVKQDIEKYYSKKYSIIICLNSKNSIDRVCKYLDFNNVYITDENHILDNKINIIIKPIGSGFIYENYFVVSENDLFKVQEKSKKYKNKYKIGTKIGNISNISKGDYIVHEQHGIGIYDQLCTITKNGLKKDYIKLIYAGGDFLYIPVEKIDRISKFSGKEGVNPKINKLGTDEWKRKKARVRGRIEEIAGNLLKVSAEREAMKGFAFSEDDENQVLFDSQFEYQETPDQLKAINIIKSEMEKRKPMDMLLCGDVGYGKTEVAFRAIFKAVNDGKQVAYLCPTTILSNQQYKNAIERFKNFPVNIALLNRFVDRAKQKKIIGDLKNGKIDILFGTHRILSNDIEYKDLGLLVIDEEQRFGVTHKEKIKQYKSNIDVLTLSATPIPRTLQMSMSGIRSLALIETAPAQRFPVQTYVLAENKNVIKDAIYKELSRNGQAFILYNKVDSIESKVREINELVPDAKINYAHGQMTKTELENIMLDFIAHKFDVLVCTTIIETGIDIPNVNTLIIIEADRFGLSQLYQIRGRIGRSDKIGYAYLMYDNRKVLNDIAVKRLNTIKEFTELGSGFKIAMRDLSIRGAGDILGSEQSGFIDTIGIDLYLKMLNEAVLKLKGQELPEEDDINDNKPLIEIDTHISDSYIEDEDLKIEIHKMINKVDSLEKMQSIKTELEDRFGKITNDMEIYMYEEWFEKLAKKLEIENSKQTKTFIELELSENISKKIDGEKLFLMAYDISKMFRFSFKNNKIHIILDTVKLDDHFLIYLIRLLEKINTELIVKD